MQTTDSEKGRYFLDQIITERFMELITEKIMQNAQQLMTCEKLTYGDDKLLIQASEESKLLIALLRQIEGKSIMGIREVLYALLKGKYRSFYGSWITKLVEIQIGLQIGLGSHKNNSHMAGWIIKQMVTHSDEYETQAYVNKLRLLWFRGGLSREVKETAQDILISHNKPVTATYGIFSPKNRKIRSN